MFDVAAFKGASEGLLRTLRSAAAVAADGAPSLPGG